jgi:hypothetical protein
MPLTGTGAGTPRQSSAAELRRMVRDNLRDRAAFVRTGHDYNTHPVTLYTYLLPLTILFTGLMKPEFPDMQPAFLGHALTTLKVGAYWLFSWALMGHIAWWAMRRGLPFIAVPMGLWVVAVALTQIIPVLFVPAFDFSLLRILRQSSLTLPSTIVAVYATAPMLRERMGFIPELVPIWSPNVRISVPLLLKLPPDRRGRLRRIHAANQYIEVVTDLGTTLLRMSLRDAVALVPQDRGWLCHRALWIRRDEVASLTFLRGQPRVTDRDGNVWPISRTAVPEIRDWLKSTDDGDLPAEGPPPVPEADDQAEAMAGTGTPTTTAPSDRSAAPTTRAPADAVVAAGRSAAAKAVAGPMAKGTTARKTGRAAKPAGRVAALQGAQAAVRAGGGDARPVAPRTRRARPAPSAD